MSEDTSLAALKQLSHVAFLKAYGYDGTIILPQLGYVQKASKTQWNILKDLPDAEGWKTIRNTRHATTAGSLVEEAKSAAEELKEELQSWYDNLPENFQNGDKGDVINTAISSLDELDSLSDLGEPLSEVFVIHHPDYWASESRSKRGTEAGSKLRSAANALRQYAEAEGTSEDDKSSAENAADELDSAADTIESVEWPTMF